MKVLRLSSLGFLATLSLAALTACNDPAEPHDHGEEVNEIELTIGNQSLRITQGGALAGATIPVGSAAISAAFRAEDGDEIELHDDEFEIRITSQNPGTVTFTRASAFTGTLNGLAAGNAVIQVELFHLEEGHSEFGPHPVTITVE